MTFIEIKLKIKMNFSYLENFILVHFIKIVHRIATYLKIFSKKFKKVNFWNIIYYIEIFEK